MMVLRFARVVLLVTTFVTAVDSIVVDGKNLFLRQESTASSSDVCPETTLEYSNHPIYVRIDLPANTEAGGQVELLNGSAGRKLTNETCAALEWDPMVFTCDLATLKWNLTSGYIQDRVPLFCNKWETGQGYISNPNDQHLEVVDVTNMTGCAALEISTTKGSLRVTFDLPIANIRGSKVEYYPGKVTSEMQQDTCNNIAWTSQKFVCDVFSGRWTLVDGVISEYELSEGCSDSGTYIENGAQPFLKIEDAVETVTEEPSMSPSLQPTNAPTRSPVHDITQAPTIGPVFLPTEVSHSQSQISLPGGTPGEMTPVADFSTPSPTTDLVVDNVAVQATENTTDTPTEIATETANDVVSTQILSEGPSQPLGIQSPSLSPVELTLDPEISTSSPTIDLDVDNVSVQPAENATETPTEIAIEATGEGTPNQNLTEAPSQQVESDFNVDDDSLQELTEAPLQEVESANGTVVEVSTMVTIAPTDALPIPVPPVKTPEPTPMPTTPPINTAASLITATDDADSAVIAYCGCAGCNQEAWDAPADSFSCGNRIQYLIGGGAFVRDACRQIAGSEHPDSCSACNPDTCVPVDDLLHPPSLAEIESQQFTKSNTTSIGSKESISTVVGSVAAQVAPVATPPIVTEEAEKGLDNDKRPHSQDHSHPPKSPSTAESSTVYTAETMAPSATPFLRATTISPTIEAAASSVTEGDESLLAESETSISKNVSAGHIDRHACLSIVLLAPCLVVAMGFTFI